ncbi:MAG: hypothetical protein KF764_08850 [Labilithrix sp.]|nr:hypothetical protein [Labilithrix sp.]
MFACSVVPTGGAPEDTETTPGLPILANDASIDPTPPDGGAPDTSLAPQNSPGTGSYSSNLGDFSINVVDVMARYSRPYPVTRALTVFASELEVELADYVGRCADEAGGVLRGSTQSVKIVLRRHASSSPGAELTPGTYKFGDGQDDASIVLAAIAPSTCESTNTSLPIDPVAAAKNELVLTTLTETHVAGTFEITMPDGKFVQGAFDTNLCSTPLLPTWTTPLCK